MTAGRSLFGPAALVESGFTDNRAELVFLQNPEGKKAIVNLHVDGILEYLSQ